MKDIHLGSARRPPAGLGPPRRREALPVKSGLLGLACVAAVFAVLGLLYSLN